MKTIYLSKETENGCAVLEGYECGINEENVFNWYSSLVGEEVARKVVQYLVSKGAKEVAIIKNIYVPEEDRNQGYGNDLVGELYDEVFNVSFILLECDNEEKNDFSLKEWYEGFGFESFNEVAELKMLEGIENLMFADME